ncbi:MAG: hypothetical protein K2X91_10895, partial [Thermoleophilia bacterium]|nr:hypothetical protein [Thermoleophilia bacterium]
PAEEAEEAIRGFLGELSRGANASKAAPVRPDTLEWPLQYVGLEVRTAETSHPVAQEWAGAQIEALRSAGSPDRFDRLSPSAVLRLVQSAIDDPAQAVAIIDGLRGRGAGSPDIDLNVLPLALLAEIGPGDDLKSRALKAIEDRLWPEPTPTARALGLMKAMAAVPALIRALDNIAIDPKGRAHCAQAIREIGPADFGAADWLRLGLAPEPDDTPKRTAAQAEREARALAELGERAFPLIRDHVEAKGVLDAAVQEATTSGALTPGKRDALRLQVGTDEIPKRRSWARRFIDRAGPQGVGLIPTCLRALDGPDAHVARLILGGLGPSAVPPLLDELRSGRPTRVPAILAILKDMNSSTWPRALQQTVRDALAPLAENRETKAEAEAVLLKIRPQPAPPPNFNLQSPRTR